MKQLKLFSLFSLCLISSCIKENTLPQNISISGTKDYTISIEDAINNLNIYLQNTKQTTRAKSIDINDVTVVSSLGVTRSNGDTLPTIDSVLYLVNFDNETGYAILSADQRLETPIIAITETGSINAQAFDIAQTSSNNYLQSEVDLGSTTIDNGSSQIINDMIVEFVFGAFEGSNFTGGIDAEGSSPNGDNDSSYYIVPPILTTIWGQNNPYNLKCPIENNQQSPAGCVAIAIGQVVAHLESDCAKLENTYDWDTIKSVGKMEDRELIEKNLIFYSQDQKDQVSTLIREIGDICDMNYGEDSSSSVPWKIDNCLQQFGFDKSDLYWFYDSESMISSVGKGLPVIISGARGIKGNGHTWVIDGYHYMTNPDNDKQSILFHCNWGWSGKCNGFYYSKVFNLSKGAVIADSKYGDKSNDVEDKHYGWLFSRVLINKK